MKILHLCLAAFYIDDFGYQENILPVVHQRLGHEVTICASTETYSSTGKLSYVEPSSYLSSSGIRVTRLAYSKCCPNKLVRKLRIYPQLEKYIKAYMPEAIFIHDSQFLSIKCVADYAKKHNVPVLVDSHTDFYNSARTFISHHFLHGWIYRWCAQKIVPVAYRYYGTLPARCDFIEDVYGVPSEIIELLPFGADVSVKNAGSRKEISNQVRKEYGINESDVLLVSGGKLDSRKNIGNLVLAINELESLNITLVLFGVIPENNTHLECLIESSIKTIYIGWQNTDRINHLFFASDIVIFPGTHSTLWEQALGCGAFCMFRFWSGMSHINDLTWTGSIVDGDVRVITDSLQLAIASEEYLLQKHVAQSQGQQYFGYEAIGQRTIDDFNNAAQVIKEEEMWLS